MDTGIGKEGYSIIGQGRIEEILKAKSDERRLLFEEATGIVKYKKRRNDAFSKLNKQKENLIRVNDILKELEIQVGPLKTQSDKAKKYLSLYDTKKLHQIALFVLDIQDKEKIEKKYVDEISDFKSNIEQQQLSYNSIEETIKNLKAEQIDLNEQLKSLNEDFANGKDFAISLNHSININEEKINSIDDNLFRLENELSNKKDEIEIKINETSVLEDKINLTTDKIDALNNTLLEKENQLLQLQKNLGDDDNVIKDFNSKILLNAENIAKCENKISNEELIYENLNYDLQYCLNSFPS